MFYLIRRSLDGTVTSIDAITNLDDKDFKKTLKITWLAEAPSAPFTPTYCVFFDHIISKAVLSKDEDFKQFIGQNTRVSNIVNQIFLSVFYLFAQFHVMFRWKSQCWVILNWRLSRKAI